MKAARLIVEWLAVVVIAAFAVMDLAGARTGGNSSGGGVHQCVCGPGCQCGDDCQCAVKQ